MAFGRISIYTPGHSGVIVDWSSLEASTPEDALLSAQNAQHDPTAGHGGGLRKRPGLIQFNLEAAGGEILGGIMMPVAGTGGAPTSAPSGPVPTDPVDPPDHNPGPGGPPGPPPHGPGGFPPTEPPPFTGRLLVIGRSDNTLTNASTGSGWYLTTKKGADVAVSAPATAPGPPRVSYYQGESGAPFSIIGRPSAIIDNVLYYLYQPGAVTTNAATILRRTDGTTDVVVATFPEYVGAGLAHGAITGGLCDMHVGADGNLYLSEEIIHAGATAFPRYGRLWKFVPSTQALTLIIDNAIVVASSVMFFENRVWWGQKAASNSGSGYVLDIGATINVLSPDLTFSTTDRTVDAQYGSISCMGIYTPESIDGYPARSCLFAGVQVRAATPIYARVFHRTTFDAFALGTAGGWIADTPATDTSAVAGNGFLSMIQFGNSFYATYMGAHSKIYKFDAALTDRSSDGTWSGACVITESFANASSAIDYSLFVDDGVLYAIGGYWGSARTLLWTVDGTTWTAATPAPLTALTNSSLPLPIFYAVDP